MSKADELRALREAKYARGAAYGVEQAKKQASAPTATGATTGSTKAKAKPPAPVAADPAPAPVAAAGGCGHKNMMGRTCTREAGHAAKSHRYS